MSGYLCRVRIDLTTAPKNNRNDIFLERLKHFDNGIIVLEQKTSTVKIFPKETKHFSEILSKAKPCDSDFNKCLSHAVRRKTIFVVNKGDVSILEENIFTTFEESIEKEFRSCVQLEYDSIQRTLCDPIYQTLIKHVRKRVTRTAYLRRNSVTIHLEPYSVNNYMTDDNEYTNGLFSLQYCVANVVQPSGIIQPGVDVHSDGGGSSQYSARQLISNSFGNPQSEHSLLYSPEIDGATSHYSGAVIVSSNGESDIEHVQQPRHPGFAEYNSREASFATWQQFVFFDIEALARAGFYYIGEGTIVRCFFCGTELANLSSQDDPLVEHVRKLPSCGYLRSHLGPSRIADYQARIRNGPIHSQQANGSVGDQSRVTSRNPGSWSASDRIRSPQYQAYSVRLASFARWPSDIRQKPEQVADAGFYYTGLQDVVRCFACDGGLKNWDPEDDPWIEHARWFLQCPFVKRIKGQEFIDLVRRMTEESDEEEDAVVFSTFQPNNPSSSNELNSQLDQENAEDVLETDAAKHALTAGYSRDIVARAINELLTKGKLDYTSKDIMELIHERKDKDERTTAAHGKMNPSPMPGPSSQKNDSKRTLIEENQRLRQSMQCVECTAAKRDILLLPCTHLCLCSNCSDKSSICPLCYKKIREKIKTEHMSRKELDFRDVALRIHWLTYINYSKERQFPTPVFLY